jgi:hypothetical protein
MAEVKVDGKTLAQAVIEFRNRPDVREYVAKSGVVLRNSEINREFKRLFNDYASRAKNVLLNNNPNLAERASLAEAANYAEKIGNAEQMKQLEAEIEGLVQRAKRGY